MRVLNHIKRIYFHRFRDERDIYPSLILLAIILVLLAGLGYLQGVPYYVLYGG